MTDLSQLSNDELMGLYHQSSAAPDIGSMVTAEAQRQGVDPDLALRLARQESGLRTNAVSPKGARGPMQLMPGTARDLGVNADDPADNIRGGVTYLKQQLDAFGDPKLALAAYNAGPGAVRKYGGVPPYAETQGYVKAIAGDAPDLSQMSNEELQALYTQGAPAAAQPVPSAGSAAAAQPAQPNLRPDDSLGFLKGAFKPVDNSARALEGAVRGSSIEAPLAAAGRGLRSMLPEGLVSFIDNPQGYYDAQAARGVRPGKLGEFAGNVAGTLPASLLPGGPLLQGAATGALLTDAKDAGGVLRDAAIGGVAGRLTALGLDKAGKYASSVLGKLPKVMSLPELETAKKAAYKAVDASGFVFPKAQAQATVSNVQAFLANKGGRDLYPEASLWVSRLKNLASQKGGLPLSQLDDLRGDIYTALVKPGGKDSVIGSQMRAEIDKLIGSAGKENALIREARDLNQRWSKARLVSNKAKSGELRAEKDYGGDFGRKVKDRVFPLIDPDNAKANLRGATPDELAALTKLATGTKTQNLASTVGGMLDPRRLGGKIVAGLTATGGGAGAIPSGGLSLLIPAAQMAAGFGLTGTASRIARQNVDDLLKLIAVGGSKQALKRTATPASRAVARTAATVRPAAGLIGGTMAAQARSSR